MLDETRRLVERERLPQYQPQVPPLAIPPVNMLHSIVRSLKNLWAEAISDPAYIHSDEETRKMAAPR